MADYIKPFIYDYKRNDNGLKEKLEQKEEEKPIAGTGCMGDFDYKNFPPQTSEANLTDKDHLDQISDKTKTILVNMESEIAENFEQRKNLEDKLTTIEKEMERRKCLYDMCLAISKEESVEIEKYSEKNKKIDTTINYLQQMVDSWQCLIDEFRKVPDECD